VLAAFVNFTLRRRSCVSKGISMASYQECMRHADECVRLAAMTDDTTVRDQIIELARGWMRTALGARNGEARVIEFPEANVVALLRAELCAKVGDGMKG
jgi:hypothetical protein